MTVRPIPSVVQSVLCLDDGAFASRPDLVGVARLKSADGRPHVLAIPAAVLVESLQSEAVVRAVAAGINNHVAVKGLHGLSFCFDDRATTAVAEYL